MKNKIIKISLLCIAIVFMIIGFYQFAKYQVINMSVNPTTLKAQNTSNIGTLVSGEINPVTYNYKVLTQNVIESLPDSEKVNTYSDILSNSTPDATHGITIAGVSSLHTPIYNDRNDTDDGRSDNIIDNKKYQMFCIEAVVPGYLLGGVATDPSLRNERKNYDIRYEDAVNYILEYNSDNSEGKGRPYLNFTTTLVLKQASQGVLKCKNGANVLKPALAYIASADDPSKWSEEKQKAVWKLLGYTASDNDHVGDSIYDNQAQNYATYDANVRNKGLKPENKTGDISVDISSDQKEYTVGPFRINYTNGIYGNVAFSGISGITVTGYDVNGQKVNKEIKISSLELKQTNGSYKTVTPKYFSPNTTTKVDEGTQAYPEPNKDFKIVLNNSHGELNNVYSISVKVKFKYMLANCEYAIMSSKGYQIHYSGSKATFNTAIPERQALISIDAIRSLYEQELELKTDILVLKDLEGSVWEDVPTGKENIPNGIKDSRDRAIPNVKVTLYDSNGNLASLYSNPNESGISEAEIAHRINPTYTDSKGNYKFEGLDSRKQYYVKFEYNGQTYLPTNKGNLAVSNTSKGIEQGTDRQTLNDRFKEIGSSPLNYISGNSLRSGELVQQSNKYYNETFSQYQLMGFVLGSDGKYTKNSNTALVDGFYTISNGNIVETNTMQEGIISKKIKEYVKNNKKYPSNSDIKTIYSNIAGTNTELWKKLQFIEDCKIVSRTDSVTPGDYTMGQGLWRRQEADLGLRKDIVYAATKINGKTEVYEYNGLSSITEDETKELARLREIYEQDRTNMTNYQNYLNYKNEIENKYYWEIQLRVAKYTNYYGGNYTRELYESDYNYVSSNSHTGSELELYVTYKVTVRNSSESVLGKITEIVDYYDKDYTYVDNLSWIMYKNNNSDDNTKIALSKQDYYDTIAKYSGSKNFQGSLNQNARTTSSNTSSRYGTASQNSGMESKYNTIYIKGLDGKKLASGEEAYLYLTFKVNKDSNNRVILDNDNSMKQNYAEINGYATYYKAGTKLPNNQTISGNDTTAGLIDIDSNPGNLKYSDITSTSNGRYEQNFEDDTDRSKSIKVTVDEEFSRSINGTVWEDQRTQNVSGAMIGDGVRQSNELGIKGVTVDLIEMLANGKEYKWQTTTTDAKGKYEFKEIIPGNYFVRFHYGDTDATVKTTANGGSNAVSYNGQDFKSTLYQKDIKNNKELSGYDETYYNIQAVDALSTNLSDAKDVWSRRTAVNSYSTSNVTNHKAEVLASPYASTINNDLIKELKENTSMTAETAIIVLETEYDRTTTNGDKTTSNGSNIYRNGNDVNGKYTLNNLDFGLTERPKAQLELNKKVTNVKVTLSNGNVLFDATKGTTDLMWTPSSTTNGNGLINVTMDEELMYGATIRITYKLTVTNVGETDFTGKDFYYKATGATNSNKVTTTANVVLDYVENNLQYIADENENWEVVSNAISTAGLNSELTQAVGQYNTILQTKKLNSVLKPGESKSVELVLTQLITPENTSDDRAYTNIAEITSISNTAGRRMANSIQGNQNPNEMPKEVDSSIAEKVVILPPFGIGNTVVYIILTISILAILIGGIVLIKKKIK